MKQPTSPEWACMRDRTITLIMVDRGPAVRGQMVEWLIATPSAGWFYVMATTTSAPRLMPTPSANG